MSQPSPYSTQLQLIKAGPMHTIQDAGRIGFQRFGVTQSGPMDVFSFEMAQHLVGNNAGESVIEFAGYGGKYKVLEADIGTALVCAVTGADVEIRRGDQRLQPWQCFVLKTGDVLEIGYAKSGVYGYLAIKGGIAIDPIMGSCSTHTRAGFGGLEGRPLRDNDAISVLPIAENDIKLNQAQDIKWPVAKNTIRVTLHRQANKFSHDEQAKFLNQTYVVSSKADRMGVHLEGEPLKHLNGHDVVSDGIVLGSIQIPGSGLPIVLMADRQPTGGYPKIATIISADIPNFAQMPAGTEFQFEAVAVELAREELYKMQCAIENAKGNCLAFTETHNLTSEFLLQHNLISGVVGDYDTYHLPHNYDIEALSEKRKCHN